MRVTPETALRTSLAGLSAAEEFFEFFGVAYDQRVVNVNRLHILKRYQQYLKRSNGLDALDTEALIAMHRELLAKAHDDFANSSGVQEKVFKVFQQADGRQHIAVDALRASLPSQK